jgi:hypothetical protein
MEFGERFIFSSFDTVISFRGISELFLNWICHKPKGVDIIILDG